MDGVAYATPPSPPTLPNISKDLLSAFWADHDVNCQPEFMTGGTRPSNWEGLDRSRKLTSQDSFPKLEEDGLCTYRTSKRSDPRPEAETLSHLYKLSSPCPEPRIKVIVCAHPPALIGSSVQNHVKFMPAAASTWMRWRRSPAASTTFGNGTVIGVLPRRRLKN